MEFFDRVRANRINEQGRKAQAAGRLEEAATLYQRAIDVAPQWSMPWYNLGLIRKWQRRWHESLECNQKAWALDRSDDAARWNLGIAATAVGDWRTARTVWQACGVQFPKVDGFVDCGLGPVAIRLNPDDAPEVVWCRRLDPARARVTSVPLPESGRRYDDIVLHDGEPKGQRMFMGRAVTVFDELALLEPSPYGTFRVDVTPAPGDDELELPKYLFECAELVAEDWTTSVRALCKACSEGLPDESHAHEPVGGGRHIVGIAARDEASVRDALGAWRAAAAGRDIGSLTRVV